MTDLTGTRTGRAAPEPGRHHQDPDEPGQTWAAGSVVCHQLAAAGHELAAVLTQLGWAADTVRVDPRTLTLTVVLSPRSADQLWKLLDRHARTVDTP
jgi:hypothetical protein